MVGKGWYTNDSETVEVAIKRMKGCILKHRNFYASLVFTEFTSCDTVKEFTTKCNVATTLMFSVSLVLVLILKMTFHMPYMLHGDVKSYLKLQRGDLFEADQLPKVTAMVNIILLVSKINKENGNLNVIAVTLNTVKILTIYPE